MLLLSFTANATHLIGGYMSYTFLGKIANGNSRYRVSLNVYRDCFQSGVPLDDNIPLGVYLNNSAKDRYQVFNFGLTAKFKVDPPGSVDCDYYAKNVCIEYGLYEGVIEVPEFTEGYHITFVRCCRNRQVNLPDQSGTPFQGQTYYCFIPNTSYENNSPVFSGVPSPYLCAKDTTSILFQAMDPDGDELSYKIVTPFQGGEPTSNGAMPDPPLNLTLPIEAVNYKVNYNSTLPFGINNGSITTIDATTGLATFYAPEPGNYVVGVEVTEKRNGVVLSTIRMDLQILVLECPPNNRPIVSSDQGKKFTIEVGEELCFNVTGTDQDGDLVKLRGSGSILDSTNGFTGTLATFTDAAAERTVSGEFCWEPDCDAARDEPYLVTFEVEDGGCPPKFNYLDVEIYVTPYEGTEDLTGPTEVCKFNAYLYEALNGQSTSTYEWEVDDGTILTDDKQSKVTIDWGNASTGKVRMREISEFGCPGPWTELDIVINESPTLPIINGEDTICISETGLVYSVNLNVGNTYEWFANNATIGNTNNNSIIIGSYGNPDFEIRVVETNATGCSSDTGVLFVHVSDPLPTLVGPTTVCPNSTNVQYVAEGFNGSTFTWQISDGSQISGSNTNTITVNWGNVGPGSVNVVETDRFGCTSPTISLSINKTYDLIANPILGPDSVCEFDVEIEYTTIPVNGSIFDWQVNGGTQVFGDSSNVIRIDWGVTGNGEVRLQERSYDFVNNKACLSDTVILPITINPRPTADEILGTMELCQYEDTFIYTVNGFANSTFEWAINGDTSNINGQGSNTISIFWDVAGSFSVSALETTEFNCPGSIIDTIVLVNPKPLTSSIIGPKVICPENSDNHVYSVSNNPTSTYEWFVFGENSFTGQGTNSITVNWETSLPSGRVEVLEISDKGCAGDTQVLNIEIDRLAIDMKVVSVGSPDDRMHVNWSLLEIADPALFTIEKKAGINPWQEIATISGTNLSYLEQPINTDIEPFTYRIKSTNKCGTDIFSEEHTNVNLQGFQNENFDINVSFTDYLGWDNGVEFYDLYESINNGAYIPHSLNLTPGAGTLITNNPDQFKKCYRVRAVELNGAGTESWSNEICFFFSPQIFVPNAFTPNNDDINDAFGVKGIAINEFSISIFNRWGEKLYDSDDMDAKWVPNYMGKEVQMGTYIYVINYTDFDNKIYTKTGTINLIR